MLAYEEEDREGGGTVLVGEGGGSRGFIHVKWMINYLNAPSGVKLMGVDGGVIGQLLYFGLDTKCGEEESWRAGGGDTEGGRED